MSDKIDRGRLIVPALGRIYEAGAPYSYAFIRFATGAILFPHGFQKVFHSSPDRLAVAIGNKGLPPAITLAYRTFFSEFVSSAGLPSILLSPTPPPTSSFPQPIPSITFPVTFR